MLNAQNVTATIAVKDLNAAKKFYAEKLGLQQTDSDGENYINYRSGNADLLVYKSQFAGGYQATVATWNINSGLEETVNQLKQKGVPFEHYDMPGMERDGDIHSAGNMKAAWCKDQDGNILCLVSDKKES